MIETECNGMLVLDFSKKKPHEDPEECIMNSERHTDNYTSSTFSNKKSYIEMTNHTKMYILHWVASSQYTEINHIQSPGLRFSSHLQVIHEQKTRAYRISFSSAIVP